jgi:beta-phosphoglucomutase-like phosphatase (HAD superfamily)
VNRAVEAAWGSVAKELGMDPKHVIEATHGKRAIDNLRELKPDLQKLPDPDMDPHVEEFETRILDNADTFQKEVRSRRESAAESLVYVVAVHGSLLYVE